MIQDLFTINKIRNTNELTTESEILENFSSFPNRLHILLTFLFGLYCVISLSFHATGFTELLNRFNSLPSMTVVVSCLVIIFPFIGTFLFYKKKTLGWFLMVIFLVYMTLEHFALGRIYFTYETFAYQFANNNGIHSFYYSKGPPELILIMSMFILATTYLMFIPSIRNMFKPSRSQIYKAVLFGILFFGVLFL